MTEDQHPQCDAVVYRRDTYRYTGRTKSGFEMHYQRGQCERRAVEDGFCRQHAKMRREIGSDYITRYSER